MKKQTTIIATLFLVANFFYGLSVKAQTKADLDAFFNKKAFGEGFITVKYIYAGITYSAIGSKSDRLINRIKAEITIKKNCLDRTQKFGFIDTTGKWVIQPIYDGAHSFINGVAAVSQCKSGGGYQSWHITLNGQPLYLQRYVDIIHDFTNGYAIVDKDGAFHWCHINKKGEPLYSQTYQWLWDFNKAGKATGIRNINFDKDICTWVVIDTQGKELYTKVATYDVDKPPADLAVYLK